jgi:hypothetical protein
MFSGSFVTQWGIGVIVELARVRWGFDDAGGLRLAFAVVLALDAVTLAWFAYGWRRYGAVSRAAVAA